MPTRLYVIPISNPSGAAAGMMRHKRIPHRLVTVMPGMHPFLVRFAGFDGHTVPALEIDGRKAQGSRTIARVLDELAPDPPLFPPDPDARAAVEEAERWGERVLQPVPRRLFRHLMVASEEARLWVGGEVIGLPGGRVLQFAFLPVLGQLARISHADEDTVRRTLRDLPGLLDRVDALIADGTIGGGQPNAADFQILASVRVLLEFEDLAHLLEGRQCAPAARLLYPDWTGPIPRGLPACPLPRERGGLGVS
jgi:glutathione S-transferase